MTLAQPAAQGGRGPREAGRTDSTALVPAPPAEEPRTDLSTRTPPVGTLENIVALVATEADRGPLPGPQPTVAAPDPPVADHAATTETGPLSRTAPPAAPEAAPVTGPVPTQPSDPLRREVSFRTAATGHYVDRISIHYHIDDRSRMIAHSLLLKLESAGLSPVEMHTTAHALPASTVRYFAPQDAAVAASLARALASNASPWRVEDCTSYRHKPEPGTVQLWPATAERHAK